MYTTSKFKNEFTQNQKRHYEAKPTIEKNSEIENNRHSESKATSRTLKALEPWQKKSQHPIKQLNAEEKAKANKKQDHKSKSNQENTIFPCFEKAEKLPNNIPMESLTFSLG